MRSSPLALVLALGALGPGSARAEPTRILDLLLHGTPPGEVTRLLGSSLQANGSAAPGSRGVPVAGGMDVDGDGLPDHAFSAVMAGLPGPPARIGAGEVLLVFGTGDAMLGGDIATAGFGPGRLRIVGAHECEIAGIEVEIGDVTGDGIGDLLIGRQNHSPDLGRPGAGALTILAGGQALRDRAATSSPLDLLCLGPAPPMADCPSAEPVTATTLIGAGGHDRLGIWMRTGDVDDDGIDDIVVGADQVDDGVEVHRGAAYVIRGGAHLAATQTVDLAAFGSGGFALAGHVALLEPPADSTDHDHLGSTVQIGDLDGDGHGEVLVAASLNRFSATLGLTVGADMLCGGSHGSTGQPAGGEVFIVWGEEFPQEPWSSDPIDLGEESDSRTRLRGVPSPAVPSNGNLGEEMLAGLDYDGDGHPDLFLGDLTGNPGVKVDGTPGDRTVAGLGYVFFGAEELRGVDMDVDDLLAAPPAGLRATVIFGPQSPAIGADTAVHGDYDGDGLADLGMCNPVDSPAGRGSAGTVHVLYGEPGGWPSVVDLAPGQLPTPAAVRIVEIRGAHGDVASPMNGGDTLCYSADGGDVDLDGVPDLLINEMKGDGKADLNGDMVLDDAVDVGNFLLIGGAPLLERVLLDVDGDGEADPLSDGVILLRHLAGVTGIDLPSGAIAAGATRLGDALETYLERMGAAIDVDGDDQLELADDGVVAVRWLFGFRGDALVAGIAFGPDAIRTTAPAIEEFLARLMP